MPNIMLKISVQPVDGDYAGNGLAVEREGSLCDNCRNLIPWNEVAYGLVYLRELHRVVDGANRTENIGLFCYRCAKVERQVIAEGVKLEHQFVQLRVAFAEM